MLKYEIISLLVYYTSVFQFITFTMSLLAYNFLTFLKFIKIRYQY